MTTSWTASATRNSHVASNLGRRLCSPPHRSRSQMTLGSVNLRASGITSFESRFTNLVRSSRHGTDHSSGQAGPGPHGRTSGSPRAVRALVYLEFDYRRYVRRIWRHLGHFLAREHRP